jgi:phosphate-selective porin OprO/OprP
MKPLRLSVLSLAVATALNPAAASAASTQQLEKELQELKKKVKQLEGALTETKAAATAQPQPVNSELEQKVKVLERKQELAEEEAAKKKKENPSFKLSEKGASFKSADGDFELKLRGYLQADARFWLDDEDQNDTDSLLLRRVRPIFEGTVFKYIGYRLMPDFAGSSVTLQDGYAELKYFPQATLRAGKFKEPIGLERLQSGSELLFVERGLPTNLVPNRDFGLQLQGEFLDGAVSYAGGVFNGVPDLGSIGASDTNDDKDFAGRIFVQPFKTVFGPLQGLGLGLAGSYGNEEGSADSPNLPSYVTQGQSRFFRYRTSSATANVGGTTVNVPPSLATTAVADGDRYRFSPQAYWYWSRFGLLTEYVSSTQEVVRGDNRADITNSAWQIAGSVVLTGEDASYKGVTPRRNFDPFNGSWGAFELAARYGELAIDDDAFAGATATGAGTALANPTTAASAANSWGVGLNWYLNRNFKINLNYDQTEFDGGGGGDNFLAPEDRQTEQVFLTRFQVAY